MKNENSKTKGNSFDELLEHNRRPAKEIYALFMDGVNKILYTSGVGTGKSYVSNCIIQALKAKKVAYIIPKHAIRTDIQRRLSNMDVDFYTYNYFSTLEIGLNTLMPYDLVIIDEAHHIGSDIYGLNLINTMNKLAGTKFLGLTATPERDSDGVNVGTFFDETVNGITVMDAQRAGLMPQYEYIMCNPNIEEIKKANKDNEKLVIDFDNSEELLADIIQNNMRNKWIAYYWSINQMKESVALIKRLFPGYEILCLDSQQQNLSEAMELMYSDQKCVIMSCSILLEGIHVPEVSGIMLFRNVCSLTVFDQILGRVSKIGGDIEPIVIDCTDTATRMFKKLQHSDKEQNGEPGFCREIYTKRNAYCVSLTNVKYINLEEMIEKFAGKQTVCGYTFENDTDLSRQLGKNKSYVNYFRQKGLSYEEIIKKAEDKTRTICGYTFGSDRDLSQQLGKGKCYVGRLRQKGLTYKEIINQAANKRKRVMNKQPQTVCEYTFKSNKDLSQQLGKNNSYVSVFRQKGLSYEEIIKKALEDKTRTICGYTFGSDRDLSRQLGRHVNYVGDLRRKSLTYEEIISRAIA